MALASPDCFFFYHEPFGEALTVGGISSHGALANAPYACIHTKCIIIFSQKPLGCPPTTSKGKNILGIWSQ
jgi:hypothetical protein